MHIKSVLITDDIEQECIDILKANGVNVAIKTSMSKEQLIDEIQHYEALLVRSATKVTRQVLEAGTRLKLVGRAGTGVDNIDMDSANEFGIVVMNTPAGNSRSAAELTCTMVLSMARHVPQAHQSMKAGVWARKDYMGLEVYGSVLAIVGIGRIGQLVAARMAAFGMHIIGYDPIVDRETAGKYGIEWCELDEVWQRADYITVHVPLITATKNLINATTLSKCKRGVKLINVARGGIIDEDALLDALNSGVCSGAALDVYLQEPPTNRKLIDHKLVICTPHLGASTIQAQQQVAREIAENIVALNAGVGLFGALNGAALVATLDDTSARWVYAAESLTKVLCELNGIRDPKTMNIEMHYPKSLAHICNALKTAVYSGMLKMATETNSHLNLVNADMRARSAGIHVDATIDETGELTIVIGKCSMRGYATIGGTVLTAIDGHQLPTVLTLVGGTTLRIGSTIDHKKTALFDVGMVGDARRIVVFNSNDDAIDATKNGFVDIRITG